MESTIDRKAYRRNSYNNYQKVEKTEIKRSNNLFLSKVINAMLLLLFVLLLKFFYFEDEFNLIKENFYDGYSYEIIKESIKSKINEIIVVEKNITSKNQIDSEENLNILIEDVDIISGKNKYLEAVEGVNQLKDDAENIKLNYEIKSPLNGTITSEFGCRISDNPIVSSYHNGLDIAANTGTNIVAAHSGTVIQAGENGTYGNSVTIKNGDLITLYAHCLKVLVKQGESVKIGQNIAKVGMTGNATGPHLHFEVKYEGRFVNPKDVIDYGVK